MTTHMTALAQGDAARREATDAGLGVDAANGVFPITPEEEEDWLEFGGDWEPPQKWLPVDEEPAEQSKWTRFLLFGLLAVGLSVTIQFGLQAAGVVQDNPSRYLSFVHTGRLLELHESVWSQSPIPTPSDRSSILGSKSCS
ncbi:hypothetical protein C8R44DRAFT_869161 [Mycena epipterygia]|nr:hypothetical protein C8R44DRAFT_869161 [Mycena epipterygia]